MPAVESVDGVVRAGVRDEFLEHLAVGGINDVPMGLLERWQINDFAVRRDGHAVATALVGFIPQDLPGDQVETDQRLQRADVKPFGGGTGADSLYVEGSPLLIQTGGGDPLDKSVIGVDVENENAVSAVFEVIADARLGHVEKPALG